MLPIAIAIDNRVWLLACAMPILQNLRFTAVVPQDPEFEHPPGVAIIRLLPADVSAAGWSTDAIDNWRDCGWSLAYRSRSSELEIVLSQIQNHEWILQVRPRYIPGLIGKLFGRKPSATDSNVYELAMAVHRALTTSPFYGMPRWQWDEFTKDATSTPEPRPAFYIADSVTNR